MKCRIRTPFLVGDNLAEAKRVFDSFDNNDFTPRIQDPQGLEQSVNKLGDSITTMLQVSAQYAIESEIKSKDLEEAVTTLTQSSNTGKFFAANCCFS